MSVTLLEELESRQNEVLNELDQLNDRIELLLKELRPPAPPTASLEAA